MARVLGFLIRYFSNYYTLHRSDLAARAAPLDPRLTCYRFTEKKTMHIFYARLFIFAVTVVFFDIQRIAKPIKIP